METTHNCTTNISVVVWLQCNTSMKFLSLSLFFFFSCHTGWLAESFPHSSVSKESACNVGDAGLIPELGRSPGKGKGYPLQHSGLENSTDSIVHGVTKSRTQLSAFHFLWLAGSEFSNQVWFKPLAVRAWSTNHWTAREFPWSFWYTYI